MDAKNKLKATLILLITLSVSIFVSCKKKPALHKIRYELHILQASKYGPNTPIYLGVTPRYEEKPPKLEGLYPDSWHYEYLGLKDGDQVYFGVDIPLSTYYENWIYIDDKEVFYRRVKVSDIHYYENTVIEARGYGDIEARGFMFKE